MLGGEPLLASDLVRNLPVPGGCAPWAAGGCAVRQLWSDFDQVATGKNTVTANRYWREKEKQGRLLHPRIDLFFYHYTVLRSQESTLVNHVFQVFKNWWLVSTAGSG